MVLGGIHASDGRDKLMFSAAAKLEGSGELLYMFGGRSSPFHPSSILSVMNLRTGATNEINCQGKLRPAARWKHSLSWTEDDQLVLVGGRDRFRSFSDVWAFDIKSMRWTLLKKLPHGLHSHSAAVWRNSGTDKSVIIISGGLKGNGILSANSNIYVMKVGGLTDVIRTSGPFISRFGHTSHVHRSKLFLVGGVATSGGQQPGVCVVDLITGASVELELETGVPAADVCLYNHDSCLQEEGERPRILVFGGGGNCFSFGSHFSKYSLEIDLATARERVNKENNNA